MPLRNLIPFKRRENIVSLDAEEQRPLKRRRGAPGLSDTLKVVRFANVEKCTIGSDNTMPLRNFIPFKRRENIASLDFEKQRPLRRRRRVSGLSDTSKVVHFANVEKSTSKVVRFANVEKSTLEFRYPSEEDKRKAWMQVDDYENIILDNMRTVLAVKEAKWNLVVIDANEYCVRGLEEQIAIYVFGSSRCRHRSNVISVLKEHRRQRRMGINDPEALAATAVANSRLDRFKALKIAAVDAFQ